jgi:hypothetical protein
MALPRPLDLLVSAGTIVAALLQVFTAFVVHLTDTQTTAINAAAAVILGVVTAAFTARDHLLPLLVGLTQALVNLALAFGLDWSQGQVAVAMAAAAALVALLGVRPQVTAVVAHDGSRVPRQRLFRLAA